MQAGQSHPEHQAYVRVPCAPGAPLRCAHPCVAWLRAGLCCSINQTDQMLAHLQSFSSVPEHFTLPDSTKSGVPLFYIPPGSTTPVSGSDAPSLHLVPPGVGVAPRPEPRTTGLLRGFLFLPLHSEAPS